MLWENSFRRAWSHSHEAGRGSRPTPHSWEIMRNPGRWSGTPRSSQSCIHASVDRQDRHHRPSTPD
jgi:hypothetical protein